MKAIKEIIISGDNVSVFFASGKIQKTTIKNLDGEKFESFKRNLKQEHCNSTIVKNSESSLLFRI